MVKPMKEWINIIRYVKCKAGSQYAYDYNGTVNAAPDTSVVSAPILRKTLAGCKK